MSVEGFGINLSLRDIVFEPLKMCTRSKITQFMRLHIQYLRKPNVNVRN